MKKALFFVFISIGCIAFAQQLPVVAVEPFETMGGITQDEARVATELFRNELASSGSLIVVDRSSFDRIYAQMEFQKSDWANNNKVAEFGRALNAGFIIRGQLMKMDTVIYITNTMIDVNTTAAVATSREQLSNMGELFNKLPSYCAQIISRIPAPNYFIGRWQSVQTNPSRTCILEFKADGSIVVERFSYSHSYVGNNTAKKTSAEEYTNQTGSYSINNNRVRILLGNFINTENLFTFDSSKNGFILGGNGLQIYRTWSNNVFFYENDVKYTSFVRLTK